VIMDLALAGLSRWAFSWAHPPKGR
jgi:hypothetical protein